MPKVLAFAILFVLIVLSTQVSAVAQTTESIASVQAVREDLQSWKHSGSIWILTTPHGASLPSESSVQNFPVLIRLQKEWFPFHEASREGTDLRFTSANGELLAHQVESWDINMGTACIWLRVPNIAGNSMQEIKLHWGNPAAKNVSSGQSVFNSDNGYAAVFHMDPSLTEETGTLTTKDRGTVDVAGVIGPARRFTQGHGVFCGDKITTLTSGSGPNTTHAWFRSDLYNVRVLGWGNEEAQGKVILNYRSPPHVRMECYFSGADVAGKTPVKKSDWIHVVHTYEKGESLLYVNGELDGVTKTNSSPLNIRNPARMWIGGWYDSFDFQGDVDEVRISNVVRSADWARLEYQNQKPLQLLTGHLVQPGTEFEVSQKEIDIKEGTQTEIIAKAGGARKVYWIEKRNGSENVVATDTFQYRFDAGRVTQDEKRYLLFRAIFENDVKTIEIPIAIHEDLPEPIFSLQAPKSWDGRSRIEIVPIVENIKELKAKQVDSTKVAWQVSGLATIHDDVDGKLVIHRSQTSGTLKITATISNGGTASSKSVEIEVKEPTNDAWVDRTPDKDEKPVDHQFYPRDNKGEGTLFFNGKLDQKVDSLVLKLFADDKIVRELRQKPKEDGTYSFSTKLKAGLIRYQAQLSIDIGGKQKVIEQADDLVCGDAFLIEGQSNAVATDWGASKVDDISNPWVRTFGSLGGDGSKGWGNAVRREGNQWQIGYWGMDLANHLVKTQGVPICIVNGAVGGTRIDQHLPNAENRTDLSTIYGRWLGRLKEAHLTHGIRAVLWHQGEADQGADGPDGGYGCETYHDYFIQMAGAWKTDMPNIQHYYLFQIWPNACSQGGNRHSDKLRDVQRLLPRDFAHMSITTTIGIKPEGSCHYPAEGYAEMAKLMIPLVEQYNYGKIPAGPITAPDLLKASYSNKEQNEIVLEFDQPIVWDEKLASQFYLDGESAKVKSGEVDGNQIKLKLIESVTADTITYLTDKRWDSKNLLLGNNGIAALTFCEVPIVASPTKKGP